jgi:hypothetical protein
VHIRQTPGRADRQEIDLCSPSLGPRREQGYDLQAVFRRTYTRGIRHRNHEVFHIEGIILHKHNYSSVIGLVSDAVDPDQITTTECKRAKPIATYIIGKRGER